MNMNKKFLYGAMLFTMAALKLPYQKGQEFVVVQGYNSPPTHINKDADAIDFSQDGCDAYGEIVAASAGGVVVLAEEDGYNGGYGTQVLIDEGNHVVARYAHMIPGTIPFAAGGTVVQGQSLGAVGNTGLVAGAACSVHPGTHLHFAMYYQNSDGSFAAVLPEPISGYRGITEGHWYLSDNDGVNLSADIGAITAPPVVISAPAAISSPAIATSDIAVDENQITSIMQTSTATTTEIATTTNTNSNGGGVVVTQSATNSSLTPASDTTSSTTPSYTISFDSSTLAVDLSWQVASSTDDAASTTYVIYEVDPTNASNTVQIATTTATSYSYSLVPSDFGGDNYFTVEASGSTIAFASTTVPAWFTAIQPIDTENSNGSWYSDNWYDLGTGFYGLIRSLTLEGSIDNSSYFKSHLYLDEYLDSGYTQLNQTFTISDNAPFTDGLQKITINDLSIPLQPNKYYRLRTYQDYQNRSVILAGTSATGTAMWDEYVYDIGIVRNYYSFYPYLAGVIIPNWPPLAAPNSPANVTTSFDTLNSILNFSWSPATDPDTTSSLLTYQWNIASSTAAPVLDPAAWQSVGKTFSASVPVAFGNTYTIGIRAIDDLGNVGAPLVVPWNFPAGYYPPPQQLDHSVGLPGGGAQEITLPATTSLSGVAFWVSPGGGFYCCSVSSVSVHSDASGTPGDIIASSSQILFTYLAPDHEVEYSFSPSLVLSPGVYWLSIEKQYNDTNIAGSAGDSYSGGEWSTSPGQDAYFRIAE